MRRTILFIALLSFVHSSYGQEDVTITAYTDKSKIVIGERLKLTVEIFIPLGRALDFPLTDTVDHFEFLSSPVIDTTQMENGTEIKGIYILTSFDSGHWVIPSFVYNETLVSDTIPIDVVFSSFDPAQEYHDLKDIIEAQPEESKHQWWYIAGAAVLLLLILLAFLLRKKKKPIEPRPVIITDPYQDAMNDLQALQSSGVDPREFHSKLSDIFRLYIYRKVGILSLQKTTDNLILRMKDLDLVKNDFDRLSQTLRLGDFVKFAKFIPAKEDDTEAFAIIKQSISTIDKLPQISGLSKS